MKPWSLHVRLGPGDKRLIAYIVKRQQSSVTVNELRESLKERLPEYMIPSAFVFLEEIPLTPQGKYDRRALPAPHRRVLRKAISLHPETFWSCG